MNKKRKPVLKEEATIILIENAIAAIQRGQHKRMVTSTEILSYLKKEGALTEILLSEGNLDEKTFKGRISQTAKHAQGNRISIATRSDGSLLLKKSAYLFYYNPDKSDYTQPELEKMEHYCKGHARSKTKSASTNKIINRPKFSNPALEGDYSNFLKVVEIYDSSVYKALQSKPAEALRAYGNYQVNKEAVLNAFLSGTTLKK